MNKMTNLTSLAVDGQSTDYQKLFPYLYIGDPIKVTQQDITNGFFQVPEAIMNNTTAGNLILKLSTAKQQGNRLEMLAQAANFINSGDFLRAPYQLSDTMLLLMQADLSELSSTEHILDFIDRTFGSIEAFKQFIVPAKVEYNNLWQSIIALLVELDYEHLWLEQLISLSKKINTLSLSLYYIETNQSIPEILLEQWHNSTLLLPKAIFPMPAQVQTGSQPAISVYQNARPYAVGTLHLIKYKLVGYQLGELKNVESILQGETKVNSSRYRNKNFTSGHDNNITKQGNTLRQQQSDQDLTRQVQQTLAERKLTTEVNNYTTNYSVATSPTATINGSWTIDDNPAGGLAQNNNDFIKDLLTETKDRVETEVFAARQQTIEQEYELNRSHTLTNGTDRNVNGFYYWLNKTYQVDARDSEKRVLIEVNFDLDDQELHKLLGENEQLSIQPPTTLSEVGVNSYSDIKAERKTVAPTNEEGPSEAEQTFYLDLCQQFDVNDAESPPSSKLVLSESIRSEQNACTSSIDLPANYLLAFGNITLTVESSVGSSDVTVTVAGKQINMTPAQGADASSGMAVLTGTFTPDSFDEHISGSLPVATMVTTSTSANDKGDVATNLNQLISIKLQLTPTNQSIEQWQFATYNKLKLGYQRQLTQYNDKLERLNAWLKANDTPQTQALINNYLVKKAMHRLYLNAMTQIGISPASPMAELPYNQYFMKALDWQNLSCDLFQSTQQPVAHQDRQFKHSTKGTLAQLDSDLYLQRFLLSTKAKVLLPIHYNQVVRFIYFLDSGQIWHGSEMLAPINPIALPIINDFKKIRRTTEDEYINVDNWRVTLPTTMSVLNDGENLDHIGEHLHD